MTAAVAATDEKRYVCVRERGSDDRDEWRRMRANRTPAGERVSERLVRKEQDIKKEKQVPYQRQGWRREKREGEGEQGTGREVEAGAGCLIYDEQSSLLLQHCLRVPRRRCLAPCHHHPIVVGVILWKQGRMVCREAGAESRGKRGRETGISLFTGQESASVSGKQKSHMHTHNHLKHNHHHHCRRREPKVKYIYPPSSQDLKSSRRIRGRQGGREGLERQKKQDMKLFREKKMKKKQKQSSR